MAVQTVNELVLFLVRRGEEGVELAHASPYDSIVADCQDLRANVPWHEIRRLATRIPCRVEKEEIHPRELEQYDRFLIYCGARPFVRQAAILDLSDVVVGLNGYDVSYWSMQFKKSAWPSNSKESPARTANAFNQLFGLV